MFLRIWVRRLPPSRRTLQNHSRFVAVAFDGDNIEAIAMAHVRHVDGRHRVVGQDRDLQAIGAVRERAPGEQRRQRALQSAQIDCFHA
jgi:hypothetical protein